MNESPEASDWSSARGAKWRTFLAPTEAMLQTVDEPLIRALYLNAPYRIADVGCGGGGGTLEILRQAPPGSVVHGYDIAPSSIEAARARVEPGHPSISFAVQDMTTASPPEQLYDRLASRFGIMFFDDPPAAFANLARWLTPGGRFAFATWGRLADNPWMRTVRDVVGEIIDLPKPDPEAPGPFRYAEAALLFSLLDQAGFTGLRVHDWRGALSIGGGLPAPEAAKYALESFSSFAEQMAEAGGGAFETALRSLTARFAAHEQGGVVPMDACVHIFTGIRNG